MTKPRVRVPAMRAFDAGKFQRRLRSVPFSVQSINAQIRHYGDTVVARSRYLCSNNPYASAAKEAFITSLIGDGIKPSPLVTERAVRETLNERFLAWTDESDADWLTDFYGQQAVIGGEMFEAGECFVRLRTRRPGDGLLVPFQLQVVPSEMLSHSHNEDLGGGRRIEMGIEFDGIGRRVAYHFLRRHPGSTMPSNFSPMDRVRVPAEEVLHLFRPTLAGQIRGVPHTVSAVAKLAMMDQYDDAELERKRGAALFGGFITSPAPEDQDDTTSGPMPGVAGPAEPVGDVGLEPGAFLNLLPGEDVKFAEPADVGGNYEVFQYRTLLSIASGFGVPYSSMTGDLRQTSYSSIRAGLVEFRRRIQMIQHAVMVYQFCRPIWNRWVREAALAGLLPVSLSSFQANLAQYQRVKWIPPHWDWVDPLDDIQAEKLAVDSLFKSRSDVIEGMGYDPEEVDRRIAQDRQRASDLGLTQEGEVQNEPQNVVRVPRRDQRSAG